MNIVEELHHMSHTSLLESLSRQLRLFGDAKISEVIIPLRDYAEEILSNSPAEDRSPSQASAGYLLYFCKQAIEKDDVDARLLELILSAWTGLDLDFIETGKAFKQGRKLNTQGVISKVIYKAVKEDPAIKNAQLWSILESTPPKGWKFCTNRLGKYAEGPKAPLDNVGYGRFCNLASEARGKLKR